MSASSKRLALNGLNGLAWAYLAFLAAWALAWRLFGDAFWWLFVLNTMAVYLFAPAPLVLVQGICRKQKAVGIVALVACVCWIGLFGKLFWPKSPSEVGGPALTVMTYNALAYNENVKPAVEAIKAADADVVTIYELNSLLAEAIRADLAEEYPYQLLRPASIDGVGVLSRYPVKTVQVGLPGNWIGEPIIHELEFGGEAVTLLCAHPYASHPDRREEMNERIRNREVAAEVIKRYVESHPGPLLLPVDFNVTPQNTAYQILTSALHDSWAEAGWGLGHTFPGADSPGSSRPKLAGVAVPKWLVRIDYVFHSPHFVATEARLGPWDGVSDHRPVMARLVLKTGEQDEIRGE